MGTTVRPRAAVRRTQATEDSVVIKLTAAACCRGSAGAFEADPDDDGCACDADEEAAAASDPRGLDAGVHGRSR